MEYLPIQIESIFESVKERVGGMEVFDDAFNNDILSSINSAFATLHQLGIDDKDGNPIVVTNADQKWDDFIEIEKYGWIRDYVFLKVRLTFDPPTNSTLLSSMQSQLDELTWRIEVERDNEINPYV